MPEETLLMLAELPPFPSSARAERSHARTGASRMRVLVVDDERLIADTLCAILNENGFEATGAYCGPDALASARRIQPHVVLTDVLMPKMSGVELGIRMRREFPDVKVCLFSGQATTSAMIHRAEAEGHFFELLPKPIHPDELIARLKGVY